MRLDDAQFGPVAERDDVFGRITPAQKERLVDSLRAAGDYVAMIGDGVNDVLSLKKSNLAVAMASGSQATRSVADIVLTDDSFAALAPAVEEGQRIINGMFDILSLFLARITTMGLIILSSLVIGVVSHPAATGLGDHAVLGRHPGGAARDLGAARAADPRLAGADDPALRAAGGDPVHLIGLSLFYVVLFLRMESIGQ